VRDLTSEMSFCYSRLRHAGPRPSRVLLGARRGCALLLGQDAPPRGGAWS
jgi:hypothetical protein